MKKQLEKYKKLFSLMIDDLKTKGKRHKQIPNILTSLRLFAPIVVIPAFLTGNIPFALISVAAFSLTDAIDEFVTYRLIFDSKDNILGVEKIDSDGKVDKLVIDGFDTVVEDSLFEIPKGYIYMNLSAFM